MNANSHGHDSKKVKQITAAKEKNENERNGSIEKTVQTIRTK